MAASILLVGAAAVAVAAALVLRQVGGRACPRRARFGRGLVPGLWRVRVLDSDRLMSMHCCWSPTEARDYAAQLRENWPGYQVSVRRPGRRRELTGGERR